jgi:DNA-binding transcriptional LysR family regulator
MMLDEIDVFVRVVQAGSIRGAAELLAMPKSTVSRKVAALEERLQARLLQRTTRTLGLTDVGRIYYDHCLRIVGEVEEAERAVRNQQASPRGLLRVSAPTNASFLGPIVSDYLKQYPDVRLELDCTARVVDLVEERFDLGIRAGTLPDSTLIARSLCSIIWILVAAPAYLKKRGRPRSPDDLLAHDCLLFGPGARLRLRSTKDAKKAKEVAAPVRLLVTDMDILHAALSRGLGIALMPAFRCADDLRARKLERVLPEWDGPSTPVHVVYPSSRHVSPTVTSFIEHLQAGISALQ